MSATVAASYPRSATTIAVASRMRTRWRSIRAVAMPAYRTGTALYSQGTWMLRDPSHATDGVKDMGLWEARRLRDASSFHHSRSCDGGHGSAVLSCCLRLRFATG